MMTKDKALQMIDEYLLTDCADANWCDCLRFVRWLIVHNAELIDTLAITNETLRKHLCADQETIAEQKEMLDAAIAGQETLQKYHHDATEIAYKNGYEAGVKEFAERLKERATFILGYWEEAVWIVDIDPIAKELTGGSEE